MTIPISLGKPISSVAPVFSSVSNSRPGYGTPISSSNQSNSETPTKLRPALPPKPIMTNTGPMPPPRQSPVPPVHGEDGTSVDDEDLPPPPPTTEPPLESPTPDSDMLNGGVLGIGRRR